MQVLSGPRPRPRSGRSGRPITVAAQKTTPGHVHWQEKKGPEPVPDSQPQRSHARRWSTLKAPEAAVLLKRSPSGSGQYLDGDPNLRNLLYTALKYRVECKCPQTFRSPAWESSGDCMFPRQLYRASLKSPLLHTYWSCVWYCFDLLLKVERESLVRREDNWL